MHGSPRIITSARRGCRWEAEKEAERTRIRNYCVRDRGSTQACENADGESPPGEENEKKKREKHRGKENGQIIISGPGWIPEQLDAPLERANSLNLIIGRASLFASSTDVVLRTRLVKLFFLRRKAVDGKGWEKVFFPLTMSATSRRVPFGEPYSVCATNLKYDKVKTISKASHQTCFHGIFSSKSHSVY